jgi:hypothetical protein
VRPAKWGHLFRKRRFLGPRCVIAYWLQPSCLPSHTLPPRTETVDVSSQWHLLRDSISTPFLSGSIRRATREYPIGPATTSLVAPFSNPLFRMLPPRMNIVPSWYIYYRVYLYWFICFSFIHGPSLVSVLHSPKSMLSMNWIHDMCTYFRSRGCFTCACNILQWPDMSLLKCLCRYLLHFRLQ